MPDTTNDSEIDRPRTRWMWTLVAIPPIAAVVTSQLAPDPHGHWTEHLSSVALKTAQLVLLIILIAMLGWRTLRPVLLVTFGIVAIGIVYQVIGDHQVASSIWRTSGNPEFGVGYDEGHETSGFGDLLVLAGGFLFAVVAGLGRRVSARVALAAVVMVVIPPPFLWPAAGVLVLVLHSLTSTSQLERWRRPAVDRVRVPSGRERRPRPMGSTAPR